MGIPMEVIGGALRRGTRVLLLRSVMQLLPLVLLLQLMRVLLRSIEMVTVAMSLLMQPAKVKEKA
ncbi:hypothetical protein I7I53_03466 [Histoplasma capsulatum var. duboisii H88]|uniref:Uncharacterized protein n=1 Tax=Ajellomyces capsulatus (strain H88) TaxID=544711 RepID=A0A8A1LR00_AJEC8|nr:hypothetical protein I7I53_03466 [Histoplasma capsulatum var. duboisii H88]